MYIYDSRSLNFS